MEEPGQRHPERDDGGEAGVSTRRLGARDEAEHEQRGDRHDARGIAPSVAAPRQAPDSTARSAGARSVARGNTADAGEHERS